MSVKMNYTCGCWIVVPNKTNSLHFIAWVITYKIVELVIKFCQANFIPFFIIFSWKCLLNWTIALRWTSAFTHEEVCEVLVVTNDKPLVHSHSYQGWIPWTLTWQAYMNRAGHSVYHFYNSVTQKWKVSIVEEGWGCGEEGEGEGDKTGEEGEEAKYIGRFLMKLGLQLWTMLSITASQWLRLVGGCNQMLEEPLWIQSFKHFVGRTGMYSIGQ